ncbi:MAG: MBL fold metallo-hydrolase [Thermoanaerobaculia bacterium]
MAKVSLRLGDLTLEGESRAGDETWFRVHPSGVAFDAGRGALPLAGAERLFLSHGHLDHALGVPFLLSQRTLHAAGDTRVYCPARIANDLERLVRAASRLEQVDYRASIEPLAAGDRVEVGRRLLVEAFATDHVVPSLGYHLIERRRRLAEPYRELASEEIATRRRAGEEVEEEREVVRLTYCGDTGPGVFSDEPKLFDAHVLLLECTFVGSAARDKGRQFGHLHIEDIVEQADRFANRHLVLHHLSRRFRRPELRAEIDRLLPGLAERVHIWGERR